MEKINFPIASDKLYTTAKNYGVFIEEGISLRGPFIIDPKGIIRYSAVHDLNVDNSIYFYQGKTTKLSWWFFKN